MQKKRKSNSQSKRSDRRRNYNSSPKSSQSKKDEERIDSKDYAKTSTNDPRWYASDPVLLRDAAQIPFSWPTGATLTHDQTAWSAFLRAPYSNIPGILSLKTVPAIGTASLATDPINVAAQSVYSFVRHANSGHSNYDATDLMLYILAMANFYSFLVWCQRNYGYALTYDQKNRYIAGELLRVNNVDASDLKNNLANFRFWINQLIAKAASFAVPATMSVFSRMSFMYSNYYVEGTDIKEQLYQFIPDGFYQFGLNSSTQMGELQYKKFDRSALMTVSDIETYGDSLFNAIWSQEDFGIMSGDILKAYGDNIIKLTSIPEFYAMVPAFDPMVLTQMKNATILDADPGSIGQASGIIIQVVQPKTYSTSDKCWDGGAMFSAGVPLLTAARLADFKDSKVLTVDSYDPTPEIVIEATRLMFGYDAYLGYVRVGTEYVDEVIITSAVGSDIHIDQVNIAGINDKKSAEYAALYDAITRHFHYCPRYTYASIVASATNQSVFEQVFDIDNFAILDNQDIIKMHAAATINMFAVPSVGKVL